MDKENSDINEIISHQNIIQDKSLSDKIELRLQKDHNITIPSIILEFLKTENSEYKEEFELKNLMNFFSNFGEVLNIVIKEKNVIVLFKTFFIGNICKEFLEKENNYLEGKKDFFKVRWFDFQNDSHLLREDIKLIFEKIHNGNIVNIRPEMKDANNNLYKNINGNNNTIGIKMNMNMNINNFNINTTMNPIGQPQNHLLQNMGNAMGMNLQQQYLQQLMKMNKNNINIPNMNNPNYLMYLAQQQNQMKNAGNINMLINRQNNLNFNNNNNPQFNKNIQMLSQMNPQLLQNQFKNFQQMKNMNNSIENQVMNQTNMNNNLNMISNNNDDKNFGKYTCKYEILIENDKDFQIARRLIGNKGCNMKKIINECKSGPDDSDKIKLRLRGRGSGYREGPDNKESDEPLHLCISAKNPEYMKKACLLVDALLDEIHKDYKAYCQENNTTPLNTNIAMRIESKNIGNNWK